MAYMDLNSEKALKLNHSLAQMQKIITCMEASMNILKVAFYIIKVTIMQDQIVIHEGD